MFEERTLYKNYSSKGSSIKEIMNRMTQREGWVEKYKENGSCKSLLIDANIIEGGEDDG